MFSIKETGIPGCHELIGPHFRDERGCFVKTFHEESFASLGLAAHFAEDYYSLSYKNVLRGLHFQLPPKDHTKLVYCLSGTVVDALVDLRLGSPTFGEYRTIELSADKANLLYLPPGIAHGFMVLSDHALLQYKVTTVYSQEHDAGILWSSVGIPWPNLEPVISTRDSGFVPLAEFKTPFAYTAEDIQ